MLAFASLVCGLIFGFGLLISGMTKPAKVLGFLDTFGRWDPTLAFVMAAALMVSGIGFSLEQVDGLQIQRPLDPSSSPSTNLWLTISENVSCQSKSISLNQPLLDNVLCR
jgi:hypothetical protein